MRHPIHHAHHAQASGRDRSGAGGARRAVLGTATTVVSPARSDLAGELPPGRVRRASETWATVLARPSPASLGAPSAGQPGYLAIERTTMAALDRVAAPVQGGLARLHLRGATGIQAGARIRTEQAEGNRPRYPTHEPVGLSPHWITRLVRAVVVTLVLAIVLGTCVQVATYSTGTAVVVFEDATEVTASAGGTIDQVFVREHELVKKDDPLIRLASPEETARLAAAESQLRSSEARVLLDQSDVQIRASLADAASRRDQALAVLDARTIRAPRDGAVTNLHVQEGSAVQPGSELLHVADESSEMEILAFLPSKDGPRIHDGMELALELEGSPRTRVVGVITQVQPGTVSGDEAATLGGGRLAGSLARQLATGTWTVVHARLPSRRFRTGAEVQPYHHGMHGKVDVKIDVRPFLSTLLP